MEDALHILHHAWESAVRSSASRPSAATACWAAVRKAYVHPSRHYHTFSHLAEMIFRLQPLRQRGYNLNRFYWAVFYHDIVYEPGRKDNEERSAAIATEHLVAMGVRDKDLQWCAEAIIATASHQRHTDPSVNYLLDADLAVLGAPAPLYQQYSRQIRQEYSMFPDPVYYSGRAEVLNRFLNDPCLYKTIYFREQLEQQARINLAAELSDIERLTRNRP